jgi:hypothetical protein
MRPVFPPRFSFPYGAIIFIASIPIGFQIANKNHGDALNITGFSQDERWAKLSENLCASNETTFSLIDLEWTVPLTRKK